MTAHSLKGRSEEFWAAVKELEKRYGVSLEHEDGFGSFIIRDERQTPGVAELYVYASLDPAWVHWRADDDRCESGKWSDFEAWVQARVPRPGL